MVKVMLMNVNWHELKEQSVKETEVGWLVFNGTFSTKRLYHAI